MAVTQADIQAVLDRIDRDELVNLALELGNIPSPYGQEKAVADRIFDWLAEEGFAPRRCGLLAERPNVYGVLKGSGGGASLVFSSHMDTGRHPDDEWVLREPKKPFYNQAWLEEDGIVGHGVENDKGPMACFMIAAKALKASGVTLPGDVILTMCPGEIGQEPVDEFQGPRYLSKELGARWLVQHGEVYADYCIAAEGTDFGVNWVQAGKAFYKLTVYGRLAYTPWHVHPQRLEENTNAIVKMARVIQELEEWARDYERKHTRHLKGGTVVPKVQIGAIRGGYPYYLIVGTEVCSAYLDIRLAPGQDPREIGAELEAILRRLGVEGKAELFLYRPANESEGVEPLVGCLEQAHRQVLGKPLQPSIPPFSSMWRDNMIFSEFGIPSLTYGPPRFTPIKIDDMVATAQVYALTALHACHLPRRAAAGR